MITYYLSQSKPPPSSHLPPNQQSFSSKFYTPKDSHNLVSRVVAYNRNISIFALSGILRTRVSHNNFAYSSHF